MKSFRASNGICSGGWRSWVSSASPEDVCAERPLEPVTVATLVAVRTSLALDPEEALVLQLAVQDLDLANAPAKAKGFVERVLGVAREVETNR